MPKTDNWSKVFDGDRYTTIYFLEITSMIDNTDPTLIKTLYLNHIEKVNLIAIKGVELRNLSSAGWI